jgi:hypothetical protein
VARPFGQAPDDRSGKPQIGVLNQGLSGNKLLNDIIGPNALGQVRSRGVTRAWITHVIAFFGNNDIIFAFGPTPP